MLQVQDLHCLRGRKAVLRGCSYTFASAQVTAILGPNGAGKSTMLECLAGVREPSQGSITLNGQAMSELPLQQVAKLRAVMRQRSELSLAFRVEEVVAFGRDPHHDAASPGGQAIIHQALEVAGIDHLQGRSYLQLSGGEQQRVHFARAIAQIEPVSEQSLLLLDEPTSAMDISHQEAVCQQARQLAARGCCVVLVVHDLQLAARYADALVLLDRGCIAQSGSVENVLAADKLEQVYGCPFVVRNLGPEIGRVVLPQLT
jgi:iron complex transport system ATP-binding protein